MSMSLRQALSLAVGPRNVDAAGHAIADWLESRHGVMASLVRTEVTKDRPAELDQEVPHDRPDTSVRSELMAKLATQREVILSLCERVDRLEMRADGLTPIERVERRWAREATVKESLTVGGDEPAVQSREPASVVDEPTDAELTQFLFDGFREWIEFACDAEEEAHGMIRNHVRFARAVLAHWGHQPAPPAEGEVIEWVRGIEPWATWLASGGCLESAQIEIEQLVISALARWGHQPTPPAEGEVGELVAWIHRQAVHGPDADEWRRAAELLQQRPEPVPVSERLPELRGMFERILCVARSSGQRPVGNIELADRLISAVASWAALPAPAGEVE